MKKVVFSLLVLSLSLTSCVSKKKFADLEAKQKTTAEMSAQEQMNANTMANLEKQIARRDALLAKKRAEENGELVESNVDPMKVLCNAKYN